MKQEIEIFLCYAREDEYLRQELEKQLRVLQRQGLVTLWHDRNISPGIEWEREINTYLNKADIILLLVSPDFMNSDYCYGNEMKRAMQLHEQGLTHVLPIILRPVYWQAAPFGKLQVLPTDAKPILSSGWHSQDEAFYNVAEGIRTTIEKLLARPHSTPPKKTTQTSQKMARQLFGEGHVFYAQGLYKEALATLQKAIQADPDDATFHNLKGAILCALQRYDEALVAFQQAIQINPNDADAYANKGVAFYQLQRYDEALVAFQQAIQINPNDAKSYTGKGTALYGLQRYDEALVAFQQAIQIDPSDTEAYSWKVAVFSQQRKLN